MFLTLFTFLYVCLHVLYIFGHHLDTTWTSFGHHWTSFGHHLDIIQILFKWTSFGHHLGIIWTSFAYHLDVTWTWAHGGLYQRIAMAFMVDLAILFSELVVGVGSIQVEDACCKQQCGCEDMLKDVSWRGRRCLSGRPQKQHTGIRDVECNVLRVTGHTQCRGHDLIIIRTLFGHHLDIMWISFGYHLDITRTSFVHHLDIIWTSFGHHLGII